MLRIFVVGGFIMSALTLGGMVTASPTTSPPSLAGGRPISGVDSGTGRGGRTASCTNCGNILPPNPAASAAAAAPPIAVNAGTAADAADAIAPAPELRIPPNPEIIPLMKALSS